jgi:hypothetical protein
MPDADAGERQRIALQPLQHREQIAGLAVSRDGCGQPLVLEHAREDERAAAVCVAAIGRDVVRVAVHQALQRTGPLAKSGRERRRELAQLLPPSVRDIGSSRWNGVPPSAS